MNKHPVHMTFQGFRKHHKTSPRRYVNYSQIMATIGKKQLYTGSKSGWYHRITEDCKKKSLPAGMPNSRFKKCGDK